MYYTKNKMVFCLSYYLTFLILKLIVCFYYICITECLSYQIKKRAKSFNYYKSYEKTKLNRYAILGVAFQLQNV